MDFFPPIRLPVKLASIIFLVVSGCGFGSTGDASDGSELFCEPGSKLCDLEGLGGRVLVCSQSGDKRTLLEKCQKYCIDGECVLNMDGCKPNCNGKQCGDDGCNGYCGECNENEGCLYNQCVVGASYPDVCATSGEGMALIACPPELPTIGCCDSKGRWVACYGKYVDCQDCSTWDPVENQCGWDSSFGDYWCVDNSGSDPHGIRPRQCPPMCFPKCSGKFCGDDGCGGSCGTCPSGYSCESGTCQDFCPCASGSCCDGCNYESSNFVCGSDADWEYGCPWGTDCGDDVGVRYRDRYCSGTSSDCNGALGSWKGWETGESCSKNE